jgi:3-oxoisoapionate kinase
MLPSASPAAPAPARQERQIIAVSGSVSPVTAAQIEWAAANGFDVIAVEATASLDERLWAAELERALEKAVASLSRGRSPLLATGRGHDEEAVAGLRRKLSAAGLDPATASARIGAGFGGILKRLASEAGVKRGAVMGGDTSGYAMRALGAYAFEAIAPIAPGAPLCRIFSSSPEMDGFEIALKGGQMGEAGFLGSVRAGGAAN